MLYKNILLLCLNLKYKAVMRKKLLVSTYLLFAVIQTFAQFEGAKQTYSAPNLKTELAKHKMVAILPFETSITYKRPPKNYDSSANKNEELNIAKNLQQSMFTYLLRKADKYTTSFQDVDRTNALLKSKGVYDHLDILTEDSICRILGVDAVLFGGIGSKTGSGALTLQIYNGIDGNLLWRFYKAMDDDVMSSTDQLMERMMRKVSRNFPYEK
jgi:hypothetical protein